MWMFTSPKVGPLKNIEMTSRWIRMLRLKWLRWIWTGNIRVNYFQLDGPMTPQAIKGEMQHTGGLVIEGWT